MSRIFNAKPYLVECTLSDPAKWTRVGLFLCGVGGLVLTVCVVLPESAERVVRSFFHKSYYTQLPVILSMLVAPIISVGVSGWIIVNSPKVATRLFPDENVTPHQVERAIYRVALTAVAVLIFAETIPNFIHAFGMTIIEHYEFGELIDIVHTFSVLNAPYLIAFVFKLLVGSYLLYGAPYLVEWQMSGSEPVVESTRFRFGISHLLAAMTLVALILGLMANGLNFYILP